MASLGQKKILVIWAGGFFLVGMIVGGLVAVKLFSPSSPPLLPISTLMEEAHRLLDKGQYAEAEKNYQAVLSRDPANPEALTHLGTVAFGRGDIDLALRYYEASLRQDPSYAHTLWDKAIALRAKGDDAGAIEAWEAFTGLFPPDASDVVQVKKWLVEARARVAGAKALSVKPPKGLSKLSEEFTERQPKDKKAK